MKKIAMFMSALALAFAFTSCEEKPDNGGNLDNVTEDGFYVAGPATGATELTADYMMAAGLNEANAEVPNRSGMYEKYIALEANKDFELVLYANGEQIRYGAKLETFDVSEKADNPRDVVVKRGVLATGADAPAMQVSKSGLYHIVLDLNEANDLAFGAQIVLAPVTWGVRGAMNGWGFTAMTEPTFNSTTMTWVLENCAVSSAGAFKFAYGAGWKLDLDDAGKVKANTNLGIEADAAGELGNNALVPNGKDINIGRGIYKITLTWTLKGGAIKNGYTATVEKTGNLEAADYSACQMELVGSGVAEQTGSSADTAWSWGQVLLASNDGKPAKSGDVYTWTWSNVQLTADGWKIRTLNAAETGGIASFDLGDGAVDKAASPNAQDSTDGNIYVTAGTYNITLAIDAATDTKTVTIVAAE